MNIKYHEKIAKQSVGIFLRQRKLREICSKIYQFSMFEYKFVTFFDGICSVLGDLYPKLPQISAYAFYLYIFECLAFQCIMIGNTRVTFHEKGTHEFRPNRLETKFVYPSIILFVSRYQYAHAPTPTTYNKKQGRVRDRESKNGRASEKGECV